MDLGNQAGNAAQAIISPLFADQSQFGGKFPRFGHGHGVLGSGFSQHPRQRFEGMATGHQHRHPHLGLPQQRPLGQGRNQPRPGQRRFATARWPQDRQQAGHRRLFHQPLEPFPEPFHLGFAAKVAIAVLFCKCRQPFVGVGAKLYRGFGSSGFLSLLGGLVNHIDGVAIAGDDRTPHRTFLNMNAAIAHYAQALPLQRQPYQGQQLVAMLP